MNLINIFTKKQLLNYYINLGSNIIYLNRNNSYYIIGIYNKLSIINTNKIVFNLKKKINVFLKFCKKKYVNFLVINTNTNKILIHKYIKYCKSINCSFFNGSWWNGLIKNFRAFIRHKTKQAKKFKIINSKFPNFIFYVDRKDSYSNNVLFINKELNTCSIPNIIFSNDNYDINKNPNSILLNAQTSLSNLFLYSFSIKLIKKGLSLNKKKFIAKILDKYKKIYFKNNKVFFEANFCIKNKKNLLKYIKWSDDLN